MYHNRRTTFVHKNIKKIKKLEPHERESLNITNFSYICLI